MTDIPLQLALIAWLPLFVSLLLLPVGLLFPGCPCCDDCGQDVFDEVYVTYSASHQVANEQNFAIYGYIDQPFPTHWYKPIRDSFNNRSEGFFFFGNIPVNEDNSGRGATNSAQVYSGFGVGTGYSIATSGSVACINIGRTQSASYPDKTPNVVQNNWRYVFNANYSGLGCEANGVDVEVRPTCPDFGLLDRWTVHCYWCAGTSDQTFQHGNSAAPTAPRIPSTGQKNQSRVTVFSKFATAPSGLFGSVVPLFPDFPADSEFTHAVRKEDLVANTSGSGSGSGSGLVPDFPSPHELPTDETIGTLWRLGAIITTTFDFNSQPKQTTTLNAAITFPRPDYLVDAAATIATGGSTLVNKLNPCSGSSCQTQSLYPGLLANNLWNSSWQNYVRPGPSNGYTGALVSFFEISEPEDSWNMSDYYALKPLAFQASNTLQPILQGGAFTPASTTGNAEITLDFP